MFQTLGDPSYHRGCSRVGYNMGNGIKTKIHFHSFSQLDCRTTGRELYRGLVTIVITDANAPISPIGCHTVRYQTKSLLSRLFLEADGRGVLRFKESLERDSWKTKEVIRHGAKRRCPRGQPRSWEGSHKVNPVLSRRNWNQEKRLFLTSGCRDQSVELFYHNVKIINGYLELV